MHRKFGLILAVGLALLAAVPGTAFAGNTPTHDLTHHLSPRVRTGDFVETASDAGHTGGVHFDSVSTWRKGWQTRYTLFGGGKEIERGVHYVVPGRKVLMGTSSASGMTFFLGRPKKLMSTRVKVGRPKKHRIRGTAYVGGEKYGKFRIVGTTTFLGFEPLTTPAWKFPSTAKVQTIQTIRVKDRLSGSVIEVRQTITAWYHRGWGAVGERRSQKSYLNGVLQEDQGTVESGFVKGRIQGEGYPETAPPPPPPTDYYLTVFNRTEGYLKNVSVGSRYVGDMAPDQKYTAHFATKPSTVRIRAESGSPFGSQLSWDNAWRPGAANIESTYLKLSSDNFSLWVTNNTFFETLDTLVFDAGLVDQQTYSIYHRPQYGVKVWYGFFPNWSNNNVHVFAGTRHWYLNQLPSPKAANSAGSPYFILTVN